MPRIDLAATVDSIQFTEEIWEWIALLEDVLHTQQEAHLSADAAGVQGDSDYKRALITGLHSARNGLHAIYLLLRFELVNQAAAQVRLLCEGLITLHYISIEPTSRAQRYWEYGYIEAYERAQALLDWERSTAEPEHIRALSAAQDSLRPDYQRLKPTFTYKDKNGIARPFRGWANKSIAEQAAECGEPIERLYTLVYKSMSAYVHGSGWALRKQGAYTPKHYDPQIVLTDFAEIIRATLVVWVDLAQFCRAQLGWSLLEHAPGFVDRLRTLDAAYAARRGTGGADGAAP